MTNILPIVNVLIKLLDNRVLTDELLSLRKLRKRKFDIIMQIINYYIASWTLLADLCQPTKSCWKVIRPETFWEKDCQLNSETFFRQNFRMRRKSFDELCKILKEMERQDTNMRKAINLEKRIAIAVYYLVSTASFRQVGDTFGVGKTTACKIVNEFCEKVCECLDQKYMTKFHLPVLKARFQCIDVGVNNQIENAPHIFKACCLLNNFLIARKDFFNENLTPADGVTSAK